MHCNQLTSLPFNLARLRGLKELDVVGNKVLEGAARLYEGRELHALQDWLAEFAAGSDIQDTVRVVLVGEGINLCLFVLFNTYLYLLFVFKEWQGRQPL